MKITGFNYSPFLIKLKKTFQSSQLIINERRGFLISVKDELGNSAIGEAAPLPGLSLETLSDDEIILNIMRGYVQDIEFPDDYKSLEITLANLHASPSVRFGFEQAIVGLLIKRNSNFIETNFGLTKPEINVNAVIGFGGVEDILSSIDEKIKSGYKTIKLKIGKDNFEDDYSLVAAVRNKFDSAIKLRLDANGKWNAVNALKYLKRLEPFNIEFIEEPGMDLLSLFDLAKDSPIPIAVDESLRSPDNAHTVIEESKIDTIIIKPGILDGFLCVLKLIQLSNALNKKVIISSSFESAVGKSALVLLASLTKHDLAHGLSTAEYFEANTCTDSFPVKDGIISFDPAKYPPDSSISL
jgi:o-succinylbenzoate synthase